MKKLFLSLGLVLICTTMVFAKAQRETVKFYVYLHCEDCINKIMKSVAYEPGVKDIVCSIDDQTAIVTFDPAKTNIPTLQEAFKKINKPASLEPLAKKEGYDECEDHDHEHHHEEETK